MKYSQAAVAVYIGSAALLVAAVPTPRVHAHTVSEFANGFNDGLSEVLNNLPRGLTDTTPADKSVPLPKTAELSTDSTLNGPVGSKGKGDGTEVMPKASKKKLSIKEAKRRKALKQKELLESENGTPKSKVVGNEDLTMTPSSRETSGDKPSHSGKSNHLDKTSLAPVPRDFDEEALYGRESSEQTPLNPSAPAPAPAPGSDTPKPAELAASGKGDQTPPQKKVGFWGRLKGNYRANKAKALDKDAAKLQAKVDTMLAKAAYEDAKAAQALATRDFEEELEAREFFDELAARDLLDELEVRDEFEGELAMRDLEYLDARDGPGLISKLRANYRQSKADSADHDVDKLQAKINTKQAKSAYETARAQQALVRREFEDELAMRSLEGLLEAREFDDFLESRDFEEEIAARSLTDAWHAVKDTVRGKVPNADPSLGQRDLFFDEEELAARDFEEYIEARDYDDELAARDFGDTLNVLHKTFLGSDSAPAPLAQRDFFGDLDELD